MIENHLKSTNRIGDEQFKARNFHIYQMVSINRMLKESMNILHFKKEKDIQNNKAH